MNEQNNNNFNDILSNGEKYKDVSNADIKKNNKVSGIWSALFLLCMLAIVGGVSYYFIFILNSKSVMVNSLQKMSANFEKIIEPLKINYQVGDKFSSTNTLKINVDGNGVNDIKDIINNSQINYNYMYDKTSKKMLLDLDTDLSDVKFNADYYVEDKNNYLFLEDIYDKFIKLEDIPIDLFANNITNADIEYIYNIIVNSFNNNLDESFITRNFSVSTNPTVTSTLDMSEGNFITLMNAVKKDLFNDTRFNEILLTFMSQNDINDIKNSEISASDTNFENLKLITTQSIITDNLSRVELVIDRVGESQRLVYEKNNDIIKLVMYNNDKEELDVNITFEGNNFDLSVTVPESQGNVLSITGKEDGEYYNYTLSMPNYSSLVNNYTTDLNEGNTNKEENNIEITLRTKFVEDSNLNYEINLGFKISGLQLTLENNGNISPLTSDIKKDISNYVTYDSVDGDEISIKLQEKFKPLIDKLNSVYSFNNNYTNTDLKYENMQEFENASLPGA